MRADCHAALAKAISIRPCKGIASSFHSSKGVAPSSYIFERELVLMKRAARGSWLGCRGRKNFTGLFEEQWYAGTVEKDREKDAIRSIT